MICDRRHAVWSLRRRPSCHAFSATVTKNAILLRKNEDTPLFRPVFCHGEGHISSTKSRVPGWEFELPKRRAPHPQEGGAQLVPGRAVLSLLREHPRVSFVIPNQGQPDLLQGACGSLREILDSHSELVGLLGSQIEDRHLGRLCRSLAPRSPY